MRLKKAGYIEDRKFVIQPTQQVIDDALEGGESLGDAIKSIFGGGGGGDKASVEEVVSESVASDESISSSSATVEEVAVSSAEEEVVSSESQPEPESGDAVAVESN